MEKLYESGIFTLRPTYIGTPDDSNGGMACKHGPGECLGDILELCAYELFKPQPKMWLGFIYCMGRNYPEIPDETYVTECALSSGLDVQKLEECAAPEGTNGMELLRASARRAIKLGIHTSCTITVNGKQVCVRDNAQWKGCSGKPEDLISEIRKAYDSQ
ncbi:hypothetical protein ABW20_dc0108069 [Dactylellina cionopaga]|nr:hypothetical protein ABW20_dc0108069 [Dactylellina cionopaga]